MQVADLIDAVSQATNHTAFPADPEDLNDDRAIWAGAAISAFQADRSGFGVRAVDEFAERTRMRIAKEDDETIIIDLIADLIHWCDRSEVSFRVAFAKAKADVITDIQEMAGNADGLDSGTVLADLLRNLELLCDRKALSYDRIVTSSLVHYEAETQSDD